MLDVGRGPDRPRLSTSGCRGQRGKDMLHVLPVDNTIVYDYCNVSMYLGRKVQYARL